MQEELCSMQPLVAVAMSSSLAVFNFGLAAKSSSVASRWSIFEVDPSDEGQIILFDDEHNIVITIAQSSQSSNSESERVRHWREYMNWCIICAKHII